MTEWVESFSLWREMRVTIKAYMSLYEREVYSFIFDRTRMFNKEWEAIPLRHFMEGIITAVGECIQPPVAMCKANLLEALRHLKGKGFVQVRERIGGASEYRLCEMKEIDIEHVASYVNRHQKKDVARVASRMYGDRSTAGRRLREAVLQAARNTTERRVARIQPDSWSEYGLHPGLNSDHPPSPNTDQHNIQNNNIQIRNLRSPDGSQQGRKLVLRKKPQ